MISAPVVTLRSTTPAPAMAQTMTANPPPQKRRKKVHASASQAPVPVQASLFPDADAPDMVMLDLAPSSPEGAQGPLQEGEPVADLQAEEESPPPDSDSDLHVTSDPGVQSGEVEDEDVGAGVAPPIGPAPSIPMFPVAFMLDPEAQVDDPLRELVNALGAVKARSNISDSAMDKVIKVR